MDRSWRDCAGLFRGLSRLFSDFISSLRPFAYSILVFNSSFSVPEGSTPDPERLMSASETSLTVPERSLTVWTSSNPEDASSTMYLDNVKPVLENSTMDWGNAKPHLESSAMEWKSSVMEWGNAKPVWESSTMEWESSATRWESSTPQWTNKSTQKLNFTPPVLTFENTPIKLETKSLAFSITITSPDTHIQTKRTRSKTLLNQTIKVPFHKSGHLKEKFSPVNEKLLDKFIFLNYRIRDHPVI